MREYTDEQVDAMLLVLERNYGIIFMTFLRNQYEDKDNFMRVESPQETRRRYMRHVLAAGDNT